MIRENLLSFSWIFPSWGLVGDQPSWKKVWCLFQSRPKFWLCETNVFMPHPLKRFSHSCTFGVPSSRSKYLNLYCHLYLYLLLLWHLFPQPPQSFSQGASSDPWLSISLYEVLPLLLLRETSHKSLAPWWSFLNPSSSEFGLRLGESFHHPYFSGARWGTGQFREMAKLWFQPYLLTRETCRWLT